MQIEIQFQFSDQIEPTAVTGVEGEMTDVLLPAHGDLVNHVGVDGKRFSGIVAQRQFFYNLPNGEDIAGQIVVLVLLDHVPQWERQVH